MAELIPIVTSLAAVLFFVYALLSRRRQLEAKTWLADAALRFEVADKQSKHFEQQWRTQQEDADRLRIQARQLEKQLEENRLKLSDRTVEWNKLKTEREDLSRRGNLQKEHLEEQVEVLTNQLGEAVREKKLLQDESLKFQKELDDRVQKQADALRTQLREAQQTLQQAKREKQQAETQLAKLKEQSEHIKPEELKRYKLKVLRLEQLYTSMRGLREMAEERNKNWETALRYFATHILNQTNAPGEAPLGPLVGAALEKIGATLVNDGGESTLDFAENSAEREPDNAQGDLRADNISAQVAPLVTAQL